jgi:type VI secretion system secreted protein VgrG
MAASATPGAIQQAEFEFEVGAHGVDDFLVLGFEVEEELSRPFSAEVTVAPKPDVDIDPQALVGQNALLTIHLAEGHRFINGVVSRVKNWQQGRGEHARQFRLLIVPRFWALSQNQRSRIFQGLSVPALVKKLLDAGNVESRLNLSGTYKPRGYCVQYGESDLGFICRLLEDEGILFFFEHEQTKHVMVLVDANSACEPVPGEERLVFREPSTRAGEFDYFDAFSMRLEVRPSAVALRDFDYGRPSVDLTAEASVQGHTLEVYEFPGGYQELSTGSHLAKLRLEEQRALAERFEGSSNARGLTAGHTFTLAEHPIDALNQKYLVVAASHRGHRPELAGFEGQPDHTDRDIYRNEIRAIRASVPFRPPRQTSRPRIPGPQTALVVGPAGEEIHTDALGRIKIQFHWDRDGKRDQDSSCWVRVSQSWAGAGWGALYLPRIGHEVVVEFLEGDPDRPLVIGSVYNGLNTPPILLPSEKTRSTLRSASSPGGDGSNELRFEDAKGQEEVYLHAQRDLTVVVENDEIQKVGRNDSLEVGHNRSRQVGANQSLQVGGDDQATIAGELSSQIGGDRTATIGGSDTDVIAGDLNAVVGGAYSFSVALASVETIGAAKSVNIGGAYEVSVGGAMNEAVGGLKSEEVGGAKSESIAGTKTETIGGARTRTIGGDLTEEVNGKRTLKIGKDLSINVAGKLSDIVADAYKLKAKEITLSADEGFSVKVGSATLELKKNGDVVIKGGKVEVKADGDIVLKGSKISEN